MSNRKTTAEKLELAKLKKEQAQARIKKLKNEQSKANRKARDNRIYKRGGLIESLLPDTTKLTEEQFHTFMHMTIANKFGKDKLAQIIAEDEKTTITQKPNQDKPAEQQYETAKSQDATSKESTSQAS